MEELKALCEVAETHPQMAYSAYNKGFKSKFTFFIRTIEGMEDYLVPVDEFLTEQFIPTLFGTDYPLEELREVLGLNPNDGGIGIPVLSEEAKFQFDSSTTITKQHVEEIINQNKNQIEISAAGENNRDELLRLNRVKKLERKEKIMGKINTCLEQKTKTLVEQARDKGASSWLNALPLEEMDFMLNKQEFR